jgi:hypothetical protein
VWLVVNGTLQALDPATALPEDGFWVWNTDLACSPGPCYVYARVKRAEDHWLFSAPIWFDVS